jgi:hypothetical protein
MRLVDHQQRVELARQRLDFRQRRRAAFHAENAVGDDQPALRPPCPLQRPPQAGDVAVLIGLDLGAAQAAAIDDAGMVQPIGDDDVAGADQRGQHPRHWRCRPRRTAPTASTPRKEARFSASASCKGVVAKTG